MTETALEERTEESAVTAYKSIFRAVLDNRPSGMRLRLARAMGKNRSFITQLANSAYQIPIPAQHLNTIFEVCHFSPAERAAFLEAYGRAHPRRTARVRGAPQERTMTLHLPDLGSQKRNRQLDALLHDFVRRLVAVLQEDESPTEHSQAGLRTTRHSRVRGNPGGRDPRAGPGPPLSRG
jgi:hypothetical protein